MGNPHRHARGFTMDQLAERAAKLLPYGPPDLRFGLRGDGVCESCEAVTVWIRVIDKATAESWRFTVPPDTPLDQLRGLVRESTKLPVQQDCLLDEHGYQFSREDSMKSVCRFSRECRLHIDLTHDNVTDAAKLFNEGAETLADKATSLVKNVWT